MAKQQPPIGPDETLNAVVARYPTTLAVLNRFGLDTCCGGAHTLQTAAAAHGLEITALVSALERAAAHA